MSMFDAILGQVLGSGETNAIVANLAAKVGLSPDQAEAAIAALAQAHPLPGDTVQAASDSTGLPQDALNQILGHLGGEGGLANIASSVLSATNGQQNG